MNNLLEILGWVLLSSVKFVLAIIPLLASSPRVWFYDIFIVAAGGCLGVFVFTFLGSVISHYLSRFHFFKIKYKNLKRFIRIKNGYGLIGIAFLTPLVISIPVGCILSAAIERDKWRVIRLQVSSVCLWSIFLFGIKGIFKLQF